LTVVCFLLLLLVEPQVVNAAMWALWSLSVTPEGRATLRAAGAVARVKDAARSHPNSNTVQASATKCLAVLE
jgi:hypothetical protein